MDSSTVATILVALIAAIVGWMTSVVTNSNSTKLLRINSSEKAACLAMRDVAVVDSAGVRTFTCNLHNVGTKFAKGVSIAWSQGSQTGNFRFVDAVASGETFSSQRAARVRVGRWRPDL